MAMVMVGDLLAVGFHHFGRHIEAGEQNNPHDRVRE